MIGWARSTDQLRPHLPQCFGQIRAGFRGPRQSHHHIERRQLGQRCSERLAHASFDAIAVYRPAQLSFPHDQSQSGSTTGWPSWARKRPEWAAHNTYGALSQHEIEVSFADQAVGATKLHVARAFRRSAGGALWRVERPAPCGRYESPCEYGSRACACASARWVGMSASWTRHRPKRERDSRYRVRDCQFTDASLSAE